MELRRIEEKINNRESKPLDIMYNYGVLVPILEREGNLELVYEVRAKDLKRQPGEISFPGGELEDGETFEKAAIRETCEELNIDKENIRVVGELDYLISYANISIYPFLGVLENIKYDSIHYSKYEVDHIFTVPIKFLMETEPKVHYADIQTITEENFPYDKIPNGKGYYWDKGKNPIYFYEYEDYIIWGLTAKITKNFIDIIKS